MRPNPLMPTRTVTAASTSRRGPHAFARPRSGKPYRACPTPAPGRPHRAAGSPDQRPRPDSRRELGSGEEDGVLLLGKHVVGDDGFRVGDPEVLGPLVG